jgi:hypothetical protein
MSKSKYKLYHTRLTLLREIIRPVKTDSVKLLFYERSGFKVHGSRFADRVWGIIWGVKWLYNGFKMALKGVKSGFRWV